MNNDQMVAILRGYMRNYALQHDVHCALSWCIAKLLKEKDSDNKARKKACTYKQTKRLPAS